MYSATCISLSSMLLLPFIGKGNQGVWFPPSTTVSLQHSLADTDVQVLEDVPFAHREEERKEVVLLRHIYLGTQAL